MARKTKKKIILLTFRSNIIKMIKSLKRKKKVMKRNRSKISRLNSK